MKIKAIKTRLFHMNDKLPVFILEYLDGSLREGSVIAVTSKIVSLAEGRVVHCPENKKEALVRSEADYYLGEIGYGCHLTIKHGLFIASSGIDQSNSEKGGFILYPKFPYESAKNIYLELKRELDLENIGVLITDSHTSPLRKGVTGIALSYWGFKGVKSIIGESDLYGRTLKMTQINIADALAASACLIMGEGAEQRPMALIENPPVQFVNQTDSSEISISPQEDLYYPIYKRFLESNQLTLSNS